jgi:hypothetical protein
MRRETPVNEKNSTKNTAKKCRKKELVITIPTAG